MYALFGLVIKISAYRTLEVDKKSPQPSFSWHDRHSNDMVELSEIRAPNSDFYVTTFRAINKNRQFERKWVGMTLRMSYMCDLTNLKVGIDGKLFLFEVAASGRIGSLLLFATSENFKPAIKMVDTSTSLPAVFNPETSKILVHQFDLAHYKMHLLSYDIIRKGNELRFGLSHSRIVK